MWVARKTVCRTSTSDSLTEPRQGNRRDRTSVRHGGPRAGAIASALRAAVGNTINTTRMVPCRQAGQRKMSILATRLMNARADSIATGSGATASRAARAFGANCETFRASARQASARGPLADPIFGMRIQGCPQAIPPVPPHPPCQISERPSALDRRLIIRRFQELVDRREVLARQALR